tara:strand:- start:2821 stop:4053 length:1233 start_codon:yes stop_codon:yes gene_type:complete
MIKKKYIAFLCSSNDLNQLLGTHKSLFKKLNHNFKKVYLINFIYFKIFSDAYGIKNKFNHELKDNIKKPQNLEIFTPQTLKELKDFMLDKEIIGIQNLSRNISDLRIHYLMAKFNIIQIIISNFGFFNSRFKTSTKDKFSKPFSNFFYFLNKSIGQKITLFLSNLRIFKKIEIRFTSDKKMLERINKSILKRIFFKLNFFYVKEIILVNSKNYDDFKENNFLSSQNKIVLLDIFLDHPEAYEIIKKISDEDKEKHYRNLNKFLNLMSNYFKKEVIICLHPKDNLESKKKIFHNFKVTQYDTVKNIYEAFIVLFFDTSAIVDAILLKKRIMFINSKYIPETWLELGRSFAKKSNILSFDIEENIKDTIPFLDERLKKQTLEYQDYIENFIQIDGDRGGLDTIISTLKKKFF